MSQDRDNPNTRDNIDRVARGFMETVHKTGNTKYTFEQAQARVKGARERGDRKRENGNR